MNKSALYKSLALHATIVILFTVEISLFGRRDFQLDQVPIIVDLNQVKISEITNLPAKATIADETKPAMGSVQPKASSRPSSGGNAGNSGGSNSRSGESAPIDDKSEDTKESYIVPPQPAKPKTPEKKNEPRKAPPPPQPKRPQTASSTSSNRKEPETAKPDTMLKNLMASVGAIEKQLSEQGGATIKEGTNVVNMGIEGGSGGSYFTELSITETDAISSRLRACWNLDPGARGIEDMIIEIRAYLNKDGSVQKVDILDDARYRGDGHFRSIADSARRAVYVCAPYNILTEKHGDKYDMWKTMLLRFNPINHTVN